MYRRILFAVDEDEALPAAVRAVSAYAHRWGAEVRVLHVHRADPGTPSAAKRPLVTSVVGRLRSEGVRADGEIRPAEHGEKVGAGIAAAATAWGADLVAIGSRGRSDLGALLGGSVSHAVTGELGLPVLVLRHSSTTPAEPRTVLVGVDCSAGSDEAVVEAAEVAAMFGAAVRIVHVQLDVAGQSAAIPEPPDEARVVVRRALAAMERRGVDATGETVLARSVVAGLASAVEREHADLVVLGSRRPSNLGGLLLGSVAHDVIHRLRCPVLLSRRIEAAESVG